MRRETGRGKGEGGRKFPRPRHCTLSKSKGFALPAALFLLVVLGGLAAWLMRMTEMGMAQDALELEGERAYQAAQAGLEAGIYGARNGSCASQDIAFTGNLSRFTASVACVAHVAEEGGVTSNLYEITSVACNQATAGACPNPASTLPEYVERHVQAVVAP